MLKSTIQWLRFHIRALPVMWHGLRGGWYVFRDQPDWFVFRFASLAPTGDPEFDGLIAQAQHEAKLRLERMERRITQGVKP